MTQNNDNKRKSLDEMSDDEYMREFNAYRQTKKNEGSKLTDVQLTRNFEREWNNAYRLEQDHSNRRSSEEWKRINRQRNSLGKKPKLAQQPKPETSPTPPIPPEYREAFPLNTQNMKLNTQPAVPDKNIAGAVREAQSQRDNNQSNNNSTQENKPFRVEDYLGKPIEEWPDQIELNNGWGSIFFRRGENGYNNLINEWNRRHTQSQNGNAAQPAEEQENDYSNVPPEIPRVTIVNEKGNTIQVPEGTPEAGKYAGDIARNEQERATAGKEGERMAEQAVSEINGGGKKSSSTPEPLNLTPEEETPEEFNAIKQNYIDRLDREASRLLQTVPNWNGRDINAIPQETLRQIDDIYNLVSEITGKRIYFNPEDPSNKTPRAGQSAQPAAQPAAENAAQPANNNTQPQPADNNSNPAASSANANASAEPAVPANPVDNNTQPANQNNNAEPPAEEPANSNDNSAQPANSNEGGKPGNQGEESIPSNINYWGREKKHSEENSTGTSESNQDTTSRTKLELDPETVRQLRELYNAFPTAVSELFPAIKDDLDPEKIAEKKKGIAFRQGMHELLENMRVLSDIGASFAGGNAYKRNAPDYRRYEAERASIDKARKDALDMLEKAKIRDNDFLRNLVTTAFGKSWVSESNQKTNSQKNENRQQDVTGSEFGYKPQARNVTNINTRTPENKKYWTAVRIVDENGNATGAKKIHFNSKEDKDSFYNSLTKFVVGTDAGISENALRNGADIGANTLLKQAFEWAQKYAGKSVSDLLNNNNIPIQDRFNYLRELLQGNPVYNDNGEEICSKLTTQQRENILGSVILSEQMTRDLLDGLGIEYTLSNVDDKTSSGQGRNNSDVVRTTNANPANNQSDSKKAMPRVV